MNERKGDGGSLREGDWREIVHKRGGIEERRDERGEIRMERDRERVQQRKVKSKRESGKERGMGKQWRK